MSRVEHTDFLVIGAGPAGLAAAQIVASAGHQVLVLDREKQPGGVPRHCFHTGFGIRDLHRLHNGPNYATERVRMAQESGAQIRTGWSVTGWEGPTSVATTSSQGRVHIQARAVLLATGCRERPRSARLVPGDRPGGVFTTGALQQLVHLAGQRVGERAVVVGAEHIAFSAVHTLTASGTRVAAVITESTGLQTFRALRAATAGLHRIPVMYEQRIEAIHGKRRLTGITLLDTATQQSRHLDCDTLVFTGDWVPDYELARAAGLDMDPATRGPRVDTTGATSTPGVFAAGNLQHPAEPADIAALGGAHAGNAVLAWLRDTTPSPTEPLASFDVQFEEPLAWITPQRIRPGTSPARGQFVLRAIQTRGPGRLVVSQNGRVLHQQRVRHLVPNRSITLRSTWTGDVDGSDPVVVRYAR